MVKQCLHVLAGSILLFAALLLILGTISTIGPPSNDSAPLWDVLLYIFIAWTAGGLLGHILRVWYEKLSGKKDPNTTRGDYLFFGFAGVFYLVVVLAFLNPFFYIFRNLGIWKRIGDFLEEEL